jgi:rSAM/selenodomain-associated transferase 2
MSRTAGRPPGVWLSVVVPALNEAEAISRTVQQARTPGVEIVVVDGGSADETMARAGAHADLVLGGARGRAAQMNLGARAAQGEVLLFLHADTLLPRGYARAVRCALADPRAVAGRFDVRLDAQGPSYALIGRLISFRSRLSGVATGDQAIFVRRTVFERIGGFPSLPLMEDIAFSRMLKRHGRIVPLRATVLTSARRWQRHGIVRTVVLMWCLRSAYHLGVPPAWLRRWYVDHAATPQPDDAVPRDGAGA